MATIFRKLSVLCFFLTVATAAAAADVAPPFKMSSADLDRAVATGTLAVGEGGPKVLVVRRTITGEVEVHDRLNDIFVIRSGRATVTVGGTVSGNRLTMPGEWRGGTISGGQSFALKPGDLVWIPAGLPHQVIVPPGREFKYLAFKSAR